MRISDWSSDVCSSDLGSFIVQPQLHAVAVARGRDLHQTPIWGKADRIVDQILDDAGQTAFLAKHHRSSRLRAGEGAADVALHAASLPPGDNADHHSSQTARLETHARQLGVPPRPYGTVGCVPSTQVEVVRPPIQTLGPPPRAPPPPHPP